MLHWSPKRSRLRYLAPEVDGKGERNIDITLNNLQAVVHGLYAAAQRPSTRPWTARTRTCNCRVDIP